MKNLTFVSLLNIILLLVGCGGGGSKNSGNKEEFHLRFSPEELVESRYQSHTLHFFPLQIKAYYEGPIPDANEIFVIATLDEPFVNMGYSLTETYAELRFYLPQELAVGIYQGSISIDICADLACARPFGPRNTLNFSFSLMNLFPVYSYRLEGAEVFEESSTDLVFFNKLGEAPQPYELHIVYPGSATEVEFPAEFLALYDVEQLTSDTFRVIPPFYSPQLSSKRYEVVFTGPGYLRQIPLDVSYRLVDENLPIASDQAIVVSEYGSVSSNRMVQYQYIGIDQPSCTDPTFKYELTKFTPGDWITVSRSSSNCFLDLYFNFANRDYGMYEGVINLQTGDGRESSVPVIMSYSREEIVFSSNPVRIYPYFSEQELSERRTFSLLSEHELGLPVAISPWVHDIREEEYHGYFRNYSYQFNIAELKKLNPMVSVNPTGLVRVSALEDDEITGLLELDLRMGVPFVFSAQPTSTPSYSPFELTIRGDIKDFGGVEIIMLSVPEGSGMEIEEPYHFDLIEIFGDDLVTGDVVLGMPALAPGYYQLNFAGIFKEHFPPIYLTVE